MKTINLKRTREIKEEIQKSPLNVEQIIGQEKDLGICITDHKGFFVTINERYCKIYGWTPEDLLGKHFTEVVPAAFKEQLTNMHDTFIKNQYEIIRNWDVQKKDKSIIKIQADAGWSDLIFDKKPHKITFVHVME